MKCIQCDTDNNLKDRTANSGRCKNCQHAFVFEPTSMPEKLTDRSFANLLTTLTAQDSLFFTSRQLAYVLSRRSQRSDIPGFVVLYLLGCVPTIFLSFPVFSLLSSVLEIPSRWIIWLILLFLWSCIYIRFLWRRSQSIPVSRRDRRSSARSLQIIGAALLLVPAGVVLIGGIPLLEMVGFAGLGLGAIGLGRRQLRRQAQLPQELLVSEQSVEGWLAKWQSINGPTKQLQPVLQSSADLAPDITNYSFDRLVVCDRSVIAKLLIANNFHFENNCAVLSITGYPRHLFDTVMTMVRRNPDLQVYVIHDCTPRGLQVVHQLKTSEQWFRDQPVAIVDLGLLPRQIFQLKDAFVLQANQSARAAQQLPADVRQSLSVQELQWLETGFFVELESFTPQRLIQVLNRGIAGSRDLVSDSSDLILIGDSNIYASDSFG